MESLNKTATFTDLVMQVKEIVNGRVAAFLLKRQMPGILSSSLQIDRNSHLGRMIEDQNLSMDEVFILLITLIPQVQPDFFDEIIHENLSQPGDFPQLGGVRGKNSRSFLPTGETALFLLAGNDLEDRLKFQKLFDADNFFVKQNILWLEDVPEGEPAMSGKIIMNREYVELFTKGSISYPKLSMSFPAQHITTEMQWDDLVLNENTLQQINELHIWVKHHHTLLQKWGMSKKIKPGYRALFFGPPGTGKTLTATLLGKYTGRDVFRVDLSMVVSKFIGETEKNLSQLFSKAENKNWILFFDEADALFSKRTNVRDAHDKYANQEAAYLLQRIESFDGLVILSSNFKSNIDEAFMRRFHSVISFALPTPAERLLIWQKGFPSKVRMAKDVDLPAISKKYDISGASIMNVVHYTCLQALSQNTREITSEMIVAGIRKEYVKEGKIW